MSWDLLEVNHRLRQRNKDLTTKVAQLTSSRDSWKRRAIARGQKVHRLREKANRQYARAELWRHRCLQKGRA